MKWTGDRQMGVWSETSLLGGGGGVGVGPVGIRGRSFQERQRLQGGAGDAWRVQLQEGGQQGWGRGSHGGEGKKPGP